MPTTQKERLLEIIGTEFEISRGRALPLGATVERGGVNFAVVSEHATSVTLVIYRAGDCDPIAEFPLDLRRNRTGNIWHVFVGGIDPGIEYGYRMDRFPNAEPHFDLFDPSRVLLDPYARGTSRAAEASNGGGVPRRSVIVDSSFDWQQDQPLDTSLANSVIYELHVGAFTRNPNSGVCSPGTFAGVAEKIPYLLDLGVTSARRTSPLSQHQLRDLP
jgi:glycogen operon protein